MAKLASYNDNADIPRPVAGVTLLDTDGNPASLSATGTGAQTTQGNVPNGAADAGNPVKIGGVGSTAAPAAVSAGQRVNGWFGLNGQQAVYMVAADGSSIWATGFLTSDNESPFTTYPGVRGFGYSYDAPSNQWKRNRGDTVAAFAKHPPLTGADRSITATTTSQTLMAANALRSKFYVRNDTATDVWINVGAAAAATAGGGNMRLAPNGGYLELTGTSSAINIIAASGTAAITSREF